MNSAPVSPAPATLIGFGGKLRSGKDTAADWLVLHAGFHKVNMSAAIHELMSAVNPIVSCTPVRYRDAPETARRLHLLWVILNPTVGVSMTRYNDVVEQVGFTEAKNNPEVRRLLQDVGTGAREVLGSNVWTDAAGIRVEKLLADGGSVVLSGVRFPSEISLVNRLRGANVWVDRPGLPPAQGITETSVSEEDFGATIDNDGTLEDLYSQVALLSGVSK